MRYIHAKNIYIFTENPLLAILDSEKGATDKTHKDSVLMDLTMLVWKTDEKQTDK